MPGGVRVSRGTTRSWATNPQRPVLDQHPMTQAEFRRLCVRLGIRDAVTAAELFGLSVRTCQRYHYGDLTVPGPLARLLRLAVLHKLTHDSLRKAAVPV